MEAPVVTIVKGGGDDNFSELREVVTDNCVGEVKQSKRYLMNWVWRTGLVFLEQGWG